MFRKFKKSILCFVSVMMLMCMGNFMNVSANEQTVEPTRTETLFITSSMEETDMIDEEGWKWEPSENGGTLTLNNFHLLITELYQYQSWTYNWGIRFEDFNTGSMINIVLIGENSITSTVEHNYGNGICVQEQYEGGSGPLIKSANITIKAEKDENDIEGSLTFNFSNENYLISPASIHADNLYIESGTIHTNTDLCMVLHGVYISGGTIDVQARDMEGSQGIQATRGPVYITGGNVSLNVANTGIYTPYYSVGDDINLLVSITGGDVTINADNPGTGYGFGINAPNIYIDTKDSINVYGEDIAIYSPASTDGANRTIQILAVGKDSSFTNSNTSSYSVLHVSGAGSTTSVPTVTINPADYTDVDSAIEKANGLNKDDYVDFSAVDSAVGAVERDVLILYQARVNAMAKAIEDAISALVYKDADYSAANEAIEKANSLDKTLYKDFTEVEKALTAVVYDLDITHQEEVNAMAKAIEDAINALEYKDADYTAVNDAIAKAEALNPEDYVDFTHVSDAIDAVVENLDITHQKEVDDMAQAILDAISELEEKPAETEPSTPTETPSTSDNSYITLWLMVMIGAAMSLIGFVVYDYKKKLTH